MSNYIRRFWKAREGTNLNKFTKSSETPTSVILENAPDAITEAGTPFTADAENNLEIGICQALAEARGLTAGLSRAFSIVVSSSRNWQGIAAAPNGDVYACVSDGDIYKQTGGTGDFIALGQTPRYWHGIAAAPNGDIYAAVSNGDIYKQTGGTGDFIALGQTPRYWRGVAAAPNGDVYASDYGGDIYKQTGGTGDFIALGQTPLLWFGMTAAPNGDIYACVYGGDIYKQTGGTGDFIALGQTPLLWFGMTAAPNGDLYACVYDGDIYKQTGGTGDFIALGQTPRYWRGIAAAPNGDVYACVYDGGIYRYQFTLSPSSCASAAVTTADVTITENRDGTLILSGALTGNRVVYLPAAVWKKTIICDCTGAYSVRVLATGQSTGGVYLAPGNAADVYCDGANVVKVPVNADKLSGYSVGNASGKIPLSNLTENLGLISQRSRLLFNRSSSDTNSILDMALSDFSTYGQGLHYYSIPASDPAHPWAIDSHAVLMGYSNYARLIAFKLNSKAIAIRILIGGTWETAWTYLTDDNGNPLHPSVATTASAANAYIGANGTTVLKSTSSRRYKTDIVSLDNADALDALRPVLYKSNPDTVPGDDPTVQHYGFIAEEVETATPILVQYAETEDGEKIPDGVQYERITVLLVKRIHELEARLKKAGI